jgi:hypothetical protein
VTSTRNVLADPVEHAAAAGAVLALDVNDLLDPLQMRRQRASVALARPVGRRRARLRVVGGLGAGDRRLDILEPQLQLVDIELL